MTLKRAYLLSVLCLLYLPVQLCAQDINALINKLTGRGQDTLSLIFIGDIMQHSPQLAAAKTATGYSYLPCFSYIAPRLRGADLTIANMETVFAGAPYAGYPVFSSPDALIPDLKTSGVDLLLTANNHICDRGSPGLKRSLQLFDSSGIMHTGTFRSPQEREERYPLLVKKNGFRLVFLNYTYGTNGFSVPLPYIVNRIDTALIAQDIVKAKRMQADFIIAGMHWGEEYQIKQSPQQEALAAFLIRQGVDLVIGSHPHVPQGMEEHRSASGELQNVVVYSLGNVVSNMTLPHTQIGFLIEVKLSKSDFCKKIDDFKYEWIVTEQRREEGVKKYYVLPMDSCKHSSASVSILPDGTPKASLNIKKTGLKYSLYK